MKTQIIITLFALMLTLGSFAQSNGQNHETQKQRDPVFYTFIINSVPDNFFLPLVGFVNDARGNHYSAQIGFVNTNRINFGGAQTGFINTVGGNAYGTQVGFINTVAGNMGGAQVGFINTVAQKTHAIQVGFINTSADTLVGAQIGFVNTAARKATAPQVGFINSAKSLNGFQLGFVNIADTIESGAALGFLSIVRKGGFHALELSVSEMYPINLAYKIGLERLYTSFIVSHNPAEASQFAIGMGLGSIVPMGKSFFFNPEFTSQSSVINGFQQANSIAARIGYSVTPKLSIIAGPSVSFRYNLDSGKSHAPLFTFTQHKINDYSQILTGARFAVQYKF